MSNQISEQALEELRSMTVAQFRELGEYSLQELNKVVEQKAKEMLMQQLVDVLKQIEVHMYNIVAFQGRQR